LISTAIIAWLLAVSVVAVAAGAAIRWLLYARHEPKPKVTAIDLARRGDERARFVASTKTAGHAIGELGRVLPLKPPKDAA